MNKAFLKEPEPDGRANCPACGGLGMAVGRATLDQHIQPTVRDKFGNDGWFCSYPDCEVAYFDLYDRRVLVGDLKQPVYPKSDEAPLCACFGFTMEDLEQAIDARSPVALRELLAKSKSSAANCSVLAANGHCCMQEIQRLYIRGTQS